MNNFYNYTIPGYNDNTFLGYYCADYNQVLSTAVPSNGQTVLFANLDQGMVWSKKIVNGIPQIQPYKIQAIYQEVQKPVEPINNSSDILAELKQLRSEIDSLKGGLNAKQHDSQYVNGTTEKPKSTSI